MSLSVVPPSRTFITPTQLSKRWVISEQALATMRWRGEGPTFIKIGARVRYPLDAVLEFELSARGGEAW